MEKNSTFLKSKKIILIDKTNFESSIALILREPDINYLIFLVFKNNIEENLELLKELKRYFFNPAKSEYLSNTIIFTEREYLANDMGVKAIITVKDISNFDVNSLNLLYEKYNFSEKNLDNFLIENSAEFSYKIDIYMMKMILGLHLLMVLEFFLSATIHMIKSCVITIKLKIFIQI